MTDTVVVDIGDTIRGLLADVEAPLVAALDDGAEAVETDPEHCARARGAYTALRHALDGLRPAYAPDGHALGRIGLVPRGPVDDLATLLDTITTAARLAALIDQADPWANTTMAALLAPLTRLVAALRAVEVDDAAPLADALTDAGGRLVLTAAQHAAHQRAARATTAALDGVATDLWTADA